MADNITTVNTGTGAIPNATTIATRDSGQGHWQQVDVGPAVPTPLSGGQYGVNVSVAPTVGTLTSIPAGATHCWLSVDPNSVAIRWTRDGTTPTATAGHYLAGGDAIELDNLAAVKFTAITSAATIQVSYHKYV